MRLIDIVKRSGKSLRNAKLRTLLTALAISVGGFTLTLTLGAGNGVRNYTEELVRNNFDPTELLVGRDPEVANDGAPTDKPQEYDDSISSFQSVGGDSSFQFKQVTRQDINDLESKDFVEEVRENYTISIQYITREGQKKYTGSVAAFNPAQKPGLKTGDIPDSGDIEAGNILIPDVYLEPLGFADAESAIGQEVQLQIAQSVRPFDPSKFTNEDGVLDTDLIGQESLSPDEKTYTFTIRAITTDPATSLSFGVSPINISSIDAEELYEFSADGTDNFDKFLYVSVRIVDGDDKSNLSAAKTELENEEYYVQTAEDIQKTITQFVDIMQGMVGALGGITLVASIFGIINTQYISVLERTREIGLMKALGMSRKNISRLFIFEAAWIGFIGGMLGIIGGLVLGLSLNPWISKSLDLGEGSDLIVFNVFQLAILLSSLMLVGAIAGLLPARKAAKLDPVEALRSE
ncbi:MAG: putative ABC transport system permease protein [Candidatus Saccharimonadales bacterium]|jgi:putative ABC transport system permease protein